jgi:hypothetical protein
MHIEHPLNQRALQLGAGPGKHIETRARQFDAAFKIHDAQRGTQIPMRYRLKIEWARLAHRFDDNIFAVVFAKRYILVRQIGHHSQQIIQARLGIVDDFFQPINACVDLAHLRLFCFAFGFIFHTSDFFGQCVALIA